MNKELNERREFIKAAIASGLYVAFSDDQILAAQTPNPLNGPPVNLGIVGAGAWGRECLAALAGSSSFRVAAIADTYEPAFKRALEISPRARTFNDYRKLLEDKDLDAILVSTPTHLHREIVTLALEAGKHVYCEAPLASSLADAKAIAQAAKGHPKLVFQSGLQGRSNALYKHIAHFVKTGVLGTQSQVIAQWNKKESWRRSAPSSEREKDLNWRLARASSLGLAGEIGIHQFDLASWYLKASPTAILGSGAILGWNDGRDVPDTVQCLLEFPRNLRMNFTSTLTSSFSGSFTVFEGTGSSLVLRENRGWMVKEADSPLLGWEVYARKEAVHNETGICMVADATKLLEEGKEPGKEGPLEPGKSALFLAFEAFARSIREAAPPPATALDGYRATLLAIRASEAINSNQKISIQAADYELA